jgi:AMP-binding enzyme/uncharacterized protein DUF6907
MPSRTGRCPRWCACNHSADTSGAAFYHASETLSVAVSRLGDPALPDRLDVQAAQYLPDDPAEPAWPPAIEIAVHAAGRYRLIGLTPPQARELARALARTADMLTALAPGPGEEQDEPAQARSRGLASLVGTPDPRRPVRVPSLDRSQRTAVRAGIGALRGDHLAKRGDQALRQPTGHPKGVCLTHAQSLRAHGWYAKLMDFRAGDRYLIIPPFFHTFGYKAGWMACIVHGVTILPQAVFDVEDVMRTIETERVSILLGPPTVFQSVLDAPRGHDFSSLRVVMASSTLTPPELLRRVRDEIKPDVIANGYGLTEATSLVTAAAPSIDDFEHIVTTVGRPAWDVEVRLVDEQGHDVPAGTPGELLVRGYGVMAGYWEDPEKTAEVIDAGGWLHTGDIATRDAEGYVTITDRKKDMVLVGGFNVYPAEVERILGQHPDVAAIAVVGAADARLGEVPVAFVVPVAGARLTEQEFFSWAAERIANFKLPRRAFLVEELPRNASMKVIKGELRARLPTLMT